MTLAKRSERQYARNVSRLFPDKQLGLLNALTAVGALTALIDFTLSNARRFYSSMGNPLAVKGLTLLCENFTFHSLFHQLPAGFLILQRLVARSMVNTNHWLRSIKTCKFPWQLTLVNYR